MGRKCPRCGSTNTTDDKENRDIICRSCGKTSSYGSPKKTKLSKKKEREPPKISEQWFRTIAVIAMMAVALFNPALTKVTDIILPFIAIGVPNIADLWGRLYLGVSLVIIGVAAYWSYTRNSLAIGIAALLIMVGVIFVYYLGPPILEATGLEMPDMGTYINPFKCTLQNLGNAEGMAQCQIQTGAGEPEGEKIGVYDVLEISFDTTYTGNDIYKSKDSEGNLRLNFDAYYLNLVVENPSDIRTIENFQIIPSDNDLDKKTGIIRSGAVKSSEKIKLADFYEASGLCMEGNGCHIEPGEILRLVLRAEPVEWCEDRGEDDCEARDLCDWDEDNIICVDDDDKKTREVEAKVTFSYDYEGEGKFDFVVASSDELAEPKLAARKNPTKSDGPVDVIVYFAPDAYVFRGTETEGKFTLVIKLEKDKAGTAHIKEPITISRLSDGILGLPESGMCLAPWSSGGPDIPLEPSDVMYTEKLWISKHEGSTKSLKESHTYFCEYTIPAHCSGTNAFDCAGEVYDITDCNSNPCCTWNYQFSYCDQKSCQGVDADSCSICSCLPPRPRASEEEDKGIPFAVRADYTYEKTITHKPIEIVSMQE